MSLGDSLMPDRTQATTLQQDVAGRESAVTPSPTETLFARTDATLDTAFTGLFGSGGPEARAALERAAATEGPAAYDRFRADPEAFGTVVGVRSRASDLGGALEALNYSKAYHAAEQNGQAPSVRGYGTPHEELSQTIGLQGGIYLDREGNQVGGFGSGSTRMFVVTDQAEARALSAAWNGGAGTQAATLQISSALEIPSLDTFRAMHADITSQDWEIREVSGVWGLDSNGRSGIARGGIGPVIERWAPSQTRASATPFVSRDGNPSPSTRALSLAGLSFQGTYHSHPDRPGKNIPSSIERTARERGGDRQQAADNDGNISIGGPGSGLSVNVLMNPGNGGLTVLYTSSGDILPVPTDTLITLNSVNNLIPK